MNYNVSTKIYIYAYFIMYAIFGVSGVYSKSFQCSISFNFVALCNVGPCCKDSLLWSHIVFEVWCMEYQGKNLKIWGLLHKRCPSLNPDIVNHYRFYYITYDIRFTTNFNLRKYVWNGIYESIYGGIILTFGVTGELIVQNFCSFTELTWKIHIFIFPKMFFIPFFFLFIYYPAP